MSVRIPATRDPAPRLSDAEPAIAAPPSGQADGVAVPGGHTPALLSTAHAALRDSEERYRGIAEELRQSTTDLVASERLYRSTFDAAPVGIVHVGLDGRWLRVNQRLCDLLDYTCDELQGQTAQELIRAQGVAGEAEALRQMADGTLARHVIDEKRYRRRDGTFVWARVNMSVHHDAAGRAQHFIAVIEDITERRTLELQIRQASKMDAIGQLASGVAHDFNNLLTVIIGFSELVAEDIAIESKHGKALSEIIKAAQRATGLTRQLLAFSRQQVMRAAPVDVNALITEMADMLGRLIGAHINIVVVQQPALFPAVVDRGQLEQVVMNLVVNARDAMPGGGRVLIETADAELDRAFFHDQVVVSGHYVMLAISDTGVGMSDETRRRLFEPFYTTKETGKGTGLGLATAYGIVKQSKGYIWVDSEPGRGTTFKVYLPRSTADADVPATHARVAAPAAGAAETVLLVEDEEGVRELSKLILLRAGYQVLDAADGDAAERLFADHAGAIDLLLSDVVMPRCGGPELFARLQSRAPGLRVLYMSGYAEPSALQKAGIDRGRPFVQKPFTAAELVRQVRHALTS